MHSGSTDPQHAIEPLSATLDDVLVVVGSHPRTEVVDRGDTWAYVTYRTALWGFVDDVAFLVEGDTVHVRSVSRVGHYDFGVNRARVERIREDLAALNADGRPAP